MNESVVYAHMVACTLGTREVAASAGWNDRAFQVLRELLRSNPLKDLPSAQLNPMAERFKRAGSCPISSAAKVISGHSAEIDWAESTTERILRAAVPAELSDLLRGTSRQVAVGSRWARLPLSCVDAEIADAHVHSGGISPPAVLVRTLLGHLSEVSEEGFPDLLEVTDRAGRRFVAEPLLLAIGISCILLQLDRDPELDMRVMLPLLGDDAVRLWPLAFEAMEAEDKLRLLRRAYNELRRQAGQAPDLQAGIGAVRAWVEDELDPVRGELARGCLAGTTLIHAAVVSPTSATLDLFVERFGLLRRLRKLGNAEEVDRIEASLRFMLSAGKLKRVELRKTAVAAVAAADGKTTRRAPSVDIEADVTSHATAIRRVRAQHPELVAQMPVSFHRYAVPASEMAFGRPRLRYPLQGVVEVAQSIARLCVGSTDIREFVGSVDVAGPELAAPNWIFGLGFTYIKRAMETDGHEPLRFTVHAGEQFFQPLDGLRRVGETLLFEAPVTRIGHGLALSRDASARRPSPLPTAAEVMESLLWASQRQPDLRDQVEPLCRDLASVVFRPWTPTFEELVEWYGARFSFDRMRDMGLVPDPSRYQHDQLPVGERADLEALRMDGRVDKMIVASVVQASVEVSYDPTAAVPPERVDIAESLTEACYEACVDSVRAEFESSRTIEACPSSNLTMADLAGFDVHPIGEFKQSGLQVTVNSDDPGLFGALVEEEIVDLYESGVLGEAEDAAEHLDQILSHSRTETAAGITSDRCGELVEALGTADSV